MAFFQCVSFSLCRFSLSASRIPSGQWQVKISRDCALQSRKPFLCRDHSWRRLKASSCACSDPAFTLVRTSLRRLSTLCSPCYGSTSGLRRPSNGNASRSRSSSLAGISTSRPTSPCRVVSFCACALPHHTRRALTPRVLQHWLSLSPASKLDAAVPRCFAPAPPLPFVKTVNTCALDSYSLALSRHHGTSSLVLSPHPLWTCLVAMLRLAVSIPSTVCYPRPAFASPCFPARSFVRDGSLLASRTCSNSQVWILTQQYGRSTYHLYPLRFSDPAPTWKNYPCQSLDSAITDVELILFTTFWESAVRIDIWLS